MSLDCRFGERKRLSWRRRLNAQLTTRALLEKRWKLTLAHFFFDACFPAHLLGGLVGHLWRVISLMRNASLSKLVPEGLRCSNRLRRDLGDKKGHPFGFRLGLAERATVTP